MKSTQFKMRALGNETEADAELISENKYTILWVQQGSGEIQIDETIFSIADDTLYYIRPGQVLRATVLEPAKGFLISFEKDFLDLFEKNASELCHTALFGHFSMFPAIRFEEDTSRFLKTITDQMYKEYTDHNELRGEIIQGFLKIFMIYLNRQCESVEKDPEKTSRTTLVRVFFTLLEKHFPDKKMVKQYADMLAITPGYLTRVVREISGFTPSDHIRKRILLEAKRRAIFKGNTMKEIAYTLGFCDPAHFSKFFKSSAGTNFTDFKRTALSAC